VSDRDLISIDSAAKDGRPKIISRGHMLARAFWTGSMWAYDVTRYPQAAIEQVDFEPTHYCELDPSRSSPPTKEPAK
jgi:hypothetical protein